MVVVVVVVVVVVGKYSCYAMPQQQLDLHRLRREAPRLTRVAACTASDGRTTPAPALTNHNSVCTSAKTAWPLLC